MQLFPTDAIQELTGAAKGAASSKAEKGTDAFAGLLANYIEEGREDYCGRPAGFAAQEEGSGTLSKRQGELFLKALRKRNVGEENIAALELLMQKSQGLTIGSAFKAVAGGVGRVSEALEGDERDAFKMLLGKMGLSKDQTEKLLDMSDEGQKANLLRSLREAFANMDGDVDATREEFASTLRALDLSDAAKAKIMRLFGDKQAASLSGAELQSLLAEAGKDIAKRANADRHAAKHVRSAMEDALAAAKAEELSGPVDDVRGNRRSEQLKAMMDDTLLGKSGAYDIKQDLGDRGEAFARDRGDGRFWTASARQAEKKTTSGAASKLLKNVGLSGEFGAVQDSAVQARNLDISGKNAGQEIFAQVEQGILQSVRNGSQRLTLQLMPEELGKLNLVLTMRQGELKALITAENADSAALLSEQMAELKATLEEQGIKVAELEVQTELRDNRFAEQWNGQKEHNEMTDSRERDRQMRLVRLRREAPGQNDAGEAERQANAIAAQGLHIVA